jgi:hypothetical protein
LWGQPTKVSSLAFSMLLDEGILSGSEKTKLKHVNTVLDDTKAEYDTI